MENRKEPRQAAVSIGNRLREAREKKSLSIDQIQKQTKIHSTVLIALEEGRASELLTDTYVRSFLRKYTQFLGLNSAEILREYFPSGSEAAPANIQIREAHLPKETMIAPKFLYVTGMAILAIILVFFVLFIGGKAVSSFKKANAEKQKKTAASGAKKNFTKAAKPAAKKKSKEKTKSESKEFIPRSAPLNLVIKVKEPVLVKLKKDGILLFERVLARGIVENVTASNNIELDIGKTKSLELTLNGRRIELPNKNVLGLVISRKGVTLK